MFIQFKFPVGARQRTESQALLREVMLNYEADMRPCAENTGNLERFCVLASLVKCLSSCFPGPSLATRGFGLICMTYRVSEGEVSTVAEGMAIVSTIQRVVRL